MHASKAAEDSPKNAESFFLETRNPEKGTCTRHKVALLALTPTNGG